MKGVEFLRKIKELARKRGVEYRFDPKHGKGGHGTLYFGLKRTTVQDRKHDIPKGTLSGMLQQLGLTLEDLKE